MQVGRGTAGVALKAKNDLALFLNAEIERGDVALTVVAGEFDAVEICRLAGRSDR
jgi:hypothetical protein